MTVCQTQIIVPLEELAGARYMLHGLVNKMRKRSQGWLDFTQKPLGCSLVACETAYKHGVFLLSPFCPLYHFPWDLVLPWSCCAGAAEGVPPASWYCTRSKVGLDSELGGGGTLYLNVVSLRKARRFVSCSSAVYTETKAIVQYFKTANT